jgi:two-component system, response regulator YesN
MDGLKLSEELRKRFPTTKVVILTGFDEFEYAQKAIKLNIIEYILKPVSSKDVIEMLTRVRTKMDEEMAQRKDMEALREYYRKSLPVLREKFLASLVASKLKKKEISEKSQNYNIDINGEAFTVSVISIDYNATAPADEGVNGERGRPTFHLIEDRELLKFAILNITEEITGKYNMGHTFLYNDYVIIIFCHAYTDRETVMVNTFTTLEVVRQSVEIYLKLTVTIGLGTISQDVSDLCKSYENAIKALDYRVLLGGNRVISIDDLEPGRMEKVVFDSLKEHTLRSCMKVGTIKELEELIEGLFKELVEARASFKDYQVYLLEMLMSVLKVAKDLSVDIDNVFGPNCNLFAEMYEFKDLQEVKGWLTSISSKIMSHISKERQDTCKQLVDKAREYIEKNYHDSEITIDKVCKYLHISPTYFSTIFKRETKHTFVNYLTQVRMEAAKELLGTTGLKAFEIAEKVGYSEPNYFSYCFKRNYGISPSEYRNSL